MQYIFNKRGLNRRAETDAAMWRSRQMPMEGRSPALTGNRELFFERSLGTI
jgi:hypothetical protein